MATLITQDIHRAAFRLTASYPRTDLGNPSDPLDDLIYVLLSGQTSEENYRSAFDALKSAYPNWESVATATSGVIESKIRCGGLSRQKAEYILSILQKLRRDFGSPTLEPLREKTTEEIEEYLTSLPGIGIKTARCVLMYTFHHEVFPADVNCLRILERLGWLSWNGQRAELLADPAQDMIPPPLRRDFHISLIQHGREICTPLNPQCGKCCLADLCKHNSKPPIEKPTLVDLCCGAGGFAWGFLQGGYEVLLGVDTSDHALLTFEANIHAPTLNQDVTAKDAVPNIRRLLKNVQPTVVIAGPPCQGFSRAGSRDPHDHRNGIFKAAIKIAIALRPDVIAFENVLNLRAPAFAHHLRQAKGVLRRAGYSFQEVVVHAEAFGVAQSRRRVVLLATKRPMKEKLKDVLKALHDRPDVPGLSVAKALEGLSLTCDKPSFIPNHVPMRHAQRVIDKIIRIAPGTGPLSYRKLHPDRSAQTLVCGHRALPCHYAVPRTITAREAARIQGFPDNFKFFGSKGNQMLQVANAVPPRLALGVAIAVNNMIAHEPRECVKSLIEKVLSRITFWPEAKVEMAAPFPKMALPLPISGVATSQFFVAKIA